MKTPPSADTTTGQAIARLLLEIGALRFSPDAPFTWSSGLKAPLYCDNRLTLSYPTVRRTLRDAFVGYIRQAYPGTAALAGVATGAIAMGMLVAEVLDLPYLYVRPKAKTHGMGNQVEGRVQPGQPTVVIEDLVSTGGSSLDAVKALRTAGVAVTGLVSIFTYGFASASRAFEASEVPFTALCDLDTLLTVAESDGLLVPSVIASIRQWGQSPETWEG